MPKTCWEGFFGVRVFKALKGGGVEAGPPHSPAAQVTCDWYHNLSQKWSNAELAWQIGAHRSSPTTKLHDRTRGQVSFEEVEQSKSEVIHCIGAGSAGMVKADRLKQYSLSSLFVGRFGAAVMQSDLLERS